MNMLQPNRLALVGGACLLLGSFLGMAANSDGLYVGISNMSALFYLLPFLGLLGLVAGLLKTTNQINMPLACMCVGGLALILSLYTGFQAKNQLDSVVVMAHEMDVQRAQFESEFNARREEFAKNFANQSQGMQEARPSEQKSGTEEQPKPVATIPEPNKAGFGIGFYLAILGSIAMVFGGWLMQKREQTNTNTQESAK